MNDRMRESLFDEEPSELVISGLKVAARKQISVSFWRRFERAVIGTAALLVISVAGWHINSSYEESHQLSKVTGLLLLDGVFIDEDGNIHTDLLDIASCADTEQFSHALLLAQGLDDFMND